MSDHSAQRRAMESEGSEGKAQTLPNPAVRSRRRFGRRALMLGAATTGAGVAATLAGGASAQAEPAGSAAVLLGKNNSAKSTTQVITRGGDGLKGQTYARDHSGVTGFDTSSASGGHGVYGRSVHGFGILGISEHGTGIVGQNSTAGQSGVAGIDMTAGSGGRGLFGQSSKGDAVFCTSESGTALHCTSPKGTALLVDGKAKFSNSGVTNVPAHHRTVKVTNGSVTPESIVLATIQKPQSGVYIEAAEPAAGSFTITLSAGPSSPLPIGWMILVH
jgi:hypothetical protein